MYLIEEVSSPKSQYFTGMNHWMEVIFPEYYPPRFDRLLSQLRRTDGRHQIQIFIGLINQKVAGLLQLFYREWQEGLLADIDLLGVLEPYRRCGLGLALVQQAFQATIFMAQAYQTSALGVVTLLDPNDAPIMRLHQKQGGQIRTDYRYLSGDVIAWYPFQEKYKNIPTPLLGEQLRQFGRLLES